MTTAIIKYNLNVIAESTDVNLLIGNDTVGEVCFSTDNGESFLPVYDFSGDAKVPNGILDLEPSPEMALLVDFEFADPKFTGQGFIQEYDGLTIKFKGTGYNDPI